MFLSVCVFVCVCQTGTDRVSSSLCLSVLMAADGTWRIHGFKWFSSATDADVTLMLARPRGAPDGSRGLSLFYARVRSDDGALNGIRIHRLKNKLGTKALPTAELELRGVHARMVRPHSDTQTDRLLQSQSHAQ
jgi:alkylation response protein AidB-like acyl-CoA dehydrogenase